MHDRFGRSESAMAEARDPNHPPSQAPATLPEVACNQRRRVNWFKPKFRMALLIPTTVC
jgi:hypothetical protein